MTPLSALLDRIFGRAEKPSKNAAKERLHMVIQADRSGISEEKMQLIVRDVRAVLARHIDFDENTFDVTLEKVDGTYALVASVPIRSVRKESAAPT